MVNMGRQVQFRLSGFFVFAALFSGSLGLFSSPAQASAPLVRIKTGFSSLTVNAGEKVRNEPLGSMITFQPAVLWEMPGFSSRFGVSYLQEMGSPFGMTTVQGIGISGYYYFFGISSSQTQPEPDVTFQRSRPGPFLFGSLTPINYNLNRFDTSNDANSNFHPSAVAFDISAGVGYDYPFTRNILFSGEFVLRNASGADSGNQRMTYDGYTIYFSVATTYF